MRDRDNTNLQDLYRSNDVTDVLNRMFEAYANEIDNRMEYQVGRELHSTKPSFKNGHFTMVDTGHEFDSHHYTYYRREAPHSTELERRPDMPFNMSDTVQGQAYPESLQITDGRESRLITDGRESRLLSETGDSYLLTNNNTPYMLTDSGDSRLLTDDNASYVPGKGIYEALPDYYTGNTVFSGSEDSLDSRYEIIDNYESSESTIFGKSEDLPALYSHTDIIDADFREADASSHPDLPVLSSSDSDLPVLSKEETALILSEGRYSIVEGEFCAPGIYDGSRVEVVDAEKEKGSDTNTWNKGHLHTEAAEAALKESMRSVAYTTDQGKTYFQLRRYSRMLGFGSVGRSLSKHEAGKSYWNMMSIMDNDEANDLSQKHHNSRLGLPQKDNGFRSRAEVYGNNTDFNNVANRRSKSNYLDKETRDPQTQQVTSGGKFTRFKTEGSYRDAKKDFDNFWRANTEYLKGFGINADKLSKHNIKKMLKDGYITQHDGSKFFLSNENKRALQDRLKLIDQKEKFTQAERHSGGAKNVAKAWIHEATKGTDAAEGYQKSRAFITLMKGSGKVLNFATGGFLAGTAQATSMAGRSGAALYERLTGKNTQAIREHIKSVGDAVTRNGMGIMNAEKTSRTAINKAMGETKRRAIKGAKEIGSRVGVATDNIKSVKVVKDKVKDGANAVIGKKNAISKRLSDIKAKITKNRVARALSKSANVALAPFRAISFTKRALNKLKKVLIKYAIIAFVSMFMIVGICTAPIIVVGGIAGGITDIFSGGGEKEEDKFARSTPLIEEMRQVWKDNLTATEKEFEKLEETIYEQEEKKRKEKYEEDKAAARKAWEDGKSDSATRSAYNQDMAQTHQWEEDAKKAFIDGGGKEEDWVSWSYPTFDEWYGDFSYPDYVPEPFELIPVVAEYRYYNGLPDDNPEYIKMTGTGLPTNQLIWSPYKTNGGSATMYSQGEVFKAVCAMAMASSEREREEAYQEAKRKAEAQNPPGTVEGIEFGMTTEMWNKVSQKAKELNEYVIKNDYNREIRDGIFYPVTKDSEGNDITEYFVYVDVSHCGIIDLMRHDQGGGWKVDDLPEGKHDYFTDVAKFVDRAIYLYEMKYEEWQEFGFDFFANALLGNLGSGLVPGAGGLAHTSDPLGAILHFSDYEAKQVLASAGLTPGTDVYKVLYWCLTHLGMTYSQGNRYGANSADCSSFVYRAFQSAGIDLGADVAASELEVTTSHIVPAAEIGGTVNGLKPGDLIFYCDSTESNGRYLGCDHVSIYVGAGMVCEAVGIGTTYRRIWNYAAANRQLVVVRLFS